MVTNFYNKIEEEKKSALIGGGITMVKDFNKFTPAGYIILLNMIIKPAKMNNDKKKMLK